MKVNYKRPFYQYVKKAHKPLQLAIEDAVEFISCNPEIGESKVGDFVGIRVYKFRFNRQEYLIAYRCLVNSPDKDTIVRCQLLCPVRVNYLGRFAIVLNCQIKALVPFNR